MDLKNFPWLQNRNSEIGQGYILNVGLIILFQNLFVLFFKEIKNFFYLFIIGVKV